MRHEFADDWRWSCMMRDKYLKLFYQKYSLEGRYVFIDKSKCSTLLQMRLAVDTVAQGFDGGSVCIEEKIERWPGHVRSNFALETDSCTIPGKEKQGWMHYARADYLLYAFEMELGGLDVYFIDFPGLQKWFLQHLEQYQSHTMTGTFNQTRFKKVPIRDVVRNIKTTRYTIDESGCQPFSSMGAA